MADPNVTRNVNKITKPDPMKIYPDLVFNDTNYSDGNATELIIPVPVIDEDADKIEDENDKTCSFTLESLLEQAQKQLDECF